MHKETAIDKTDVKILKLLLEESRTSFTDIAKCCGISVGAVRMRYARLKQTGVVTGEIMQVNPYVLGYKCISDLGIKTTQENEAEVGAFLKTKPYLVHIVNAANNYNFWAKVMLHDIKELNGILSELECHPLIKHVDTFIWDEVVNLDHPENLTIKPLENFGNEKAVSQFTLVRLEEMQIDKIDHQIAKILTQQSRVPFKRIGEKLGISTKSVIKRYNRLRQNVLPHSSIMIDLNKLGYTAWAHLFIKAANRSKMPETFAEILRTPNLIVAIRYIGAYDMYATVALADYDELFQLTERFRRIKGIEQTDIFLGRTFPQWPLNLFHSLL